MNGDDMTFEQKNVTVDGNDNNRDNEGQNPVDSSGRPKFGKEDDQDSLVSGHSSSRLEKLANLELVWQKANSINGIRKMNMLFKDERRQIQALDETGQITKEYWAVCEQFVQIIEKKQIENLKILT